MNQEQGSVYKICIILNKKVITVMKEIFVTN